jgi:peptidoglycan lytic transglycosylase
MRDVPGGAGTTASTGAARNRSGVPIAPRSWNQTAQLRFTYAEEPPGHFAVRLNLYRSLLMTVLALASIASEARAESGLASYYGGRGLRGEMTCAHRTRPLGSMVTVVYAGHSIRCRVNDRGPFIRGRVIDVSTSAARALGMMRSGVVRVSVE